MLATCRAAIAVIGVLQLDDALGSLTPFLLAGSASQPRSWRTPYFRSLPRSGKAYARTEYRPGSASRPCRYQPSGLRTRCCFPASCEGTRVARRASRACGVVELPFGRYLPAV